MAKYFLGSVGKAEAFKRDDNGNLVLAFVSNTLTDSGLNISTTKDDIRAGQGAPIQFSFYHDPSVEITLTDVLWRKEYVEAQLGAMFDDVDGEDYTVKTIKCTSAGTIVLPTDAIELPGVVCGDGKALVAWAVEAGKDNWKSYEINDDKKTIESNNFEADKTYCVRYLTANQNAKVAKITSLIVPQELFLIITAPIFAGDACAASKGKAAGHITFEVPRFQLNGSQDFSMNMSSNQTMSLAGIAAAIDSADCEAQGSKLLRIIEVIDTEDYKKDIASLVIDEDCLVVGSTPVVYGVKSNGKLVKLDNTELTFDPALVDGKFNAAGEVDVTLTGTEVTDTVTVVSE